MPFFDKLRKLNFKVQKKIKQTFFYVQTLKIEIKKKAKIKFTCPKKKI